ncbi:hypothetical protein [Sorangium sp. So ce426]|uniref:hypothetical protein n=1 Tax=unclassified Sorangium TaxID=2621164 RepID=UPI003F5B6D52
MKIERMWCVVDPGPVAELADICFESTPADLIRSTATMFFLGRGDWAERRSKIALYTNESEARTDAERRLAARDGREAPAPTLSCRVWEIFGGHVRLYESGDVRHWDEGVGKWAPGWGRWMDETRDWNADEKPCRAWRGAVEAYQTRPPADDAESP